MKSIEEIVFYITNNQANKSLLKEICNLIEVEEGFKAEAQEKKEKYKNECNRGCCP